MEEISVITAVHHPLRRRIFDYLILNGNSQVTALARALDAQVGSISHHLRMLERAGVVERGEDPSGDKRTSWWRIARESLSWSVDDYSDSPGDALMAREAERQNLRSQFERLQRWRRIRKEPEYADYDAFNMDGLTWASPAELSDLMRRVQQTVDTWRKEIDKDDGQSRVPVFFYAHAFPSEP